jgi:histidinol-phosphatase (PHP family)
VLTDYHLHLRPDDTGEADDCFSDQNVDRYLASAEEHGIDELGVSEHVYRFTQALEIWRHPYWEGSALDDLDTYVEFVRSTPLKLGI